MILTSPPLSYFLQAALTRLDHSHQKEKASVARAGTPRRPPSRSSRGSSRASKKSSCENLSLLNYEEFDNESIVIPRIVNIEVRLEEGTETNVNVATERHSNIENKPKSTSTPCFTDFSSRLHSPRLLKSDLRHEHASLGYVLSNKNIGQKSSYSKLKDLNYCESDISDCTNKSKSSDYISNLNICSSSLYSNYSDSQKLELLNKTPNTYDIDVKINENKTSSDTEVAISDHESIADSGVVNRRTIIRINEKSKSANSLSEDNTEPLWVRDLSSRRSLRSAQEYPRERIVPITVDSDFCGGINVSIKENEPQRKDVTRMYVRGSDSENRPARASAFNVRRTIEKRQLQQERRERRALREQIREHLRSLSEGRERTISSSSSTHLSTNSIRSKSLSSLDQDSDDNRCESPLFKVQSNPTLDTEKEGVRQYLFGSNLVDASPVSARLVARVMSPCPSESSDKSKCNHDIKSSEASENLKTCQKLDETKIIKNKTTNRSTDLLKDYDKSRRASITSSILSSSASKYSWFDNISTNKENIKERNLENESQLGSLQITNSNISSVFDEESISSFKESAISSPVPTPPPRRNKIRRSTGQLTLEDKDRPAWVRLAKERRSLRSSNQVVEQLSDRASSVASREPEWVSKARKKLENLNVCLTKTTDFNSVSSQVTESSSAWSRGGLDALNDLRDEAMRIGIELAEEATIRVDEELGFQSLPPDTKMLEAPKSPGSYEPHSERHRVSFDDASIEPSSGSMHKKSTRNSKSPPKDEVRFGDLKHDWGGAHKVKSKSVSMKHSEPRNRNVSQKSNDDQPLKNGNVHPSNLNGDSEHIKTVPGGSNNQLPDTKRPIMHFGDTPLNMFSPPKTERSVFHSSKFESIPGPDPTTMTVEQLNQNVEEYDFPIPTGQEDATELLKAMEESIKRTEIVPEIVSEEIEKPKLKSILKRRSVENVHQESKTENKSQEINFKTRNEEDMTNGKENNTSNKPLLNIRNQTNSINLNLESDSALIKRRFSISEQNLSFSKHTDLNDNKNFEDSIAEKEHHSLNFTNTSNSTTQAAGSFFKVKLRPVKQIPDVDNLDIKNGNPQSNSNLINHCSAEYIDIGEVTDDLIQNSPKIGRVERQKNRFETKLSKLNLHAKQNKNNPDDSVNNNSNNVNNNKPSNLPNPTSTNHIEKSYISANTFKLKNSQPETIKMAEKRQGFQVFRNSIQESAKMTSSSTSWSSSTCRSMRGISPASK